MIKLNIIRILRIKFVHRYVNVSKSSLFAWLLPYKAKNALTADGIEMRRTLAKDLKFKTVHFTSDTLTYTDTNTKLIHVI